MPEYQCPDCHATLRRNDPLPAGKKIKCPKCGSIFAALAKASAAAPARPVTAPAAASNSDDDIDRNPYAVRADDNETDTARMEKQRAAAGIVLDRFKKSKRGPAQKEVVRPANFLLATGILWFIIGIVVVLIAVFPLVFRDFYNAPVPKEGQKYADVEAQGRPKVDPEVWRKQVIKSSIMLGACVFSFIWSGLVCVGAFKMHTLESYGWAMTGAIMGMFLFPYATGVWALVTLRNPAVIAGFEEEKPDDV